LSLDYWEVSRERGREADGEDGGRPGDRKKGRRGRRGIARGSPGILLVARKQEVASELQEASTLELPVTHEEDNGLFAKSPLGIGDSMGCLKQP
jgi:hypothetical protein